MDIQALAYMVREIVIPEMKKPATAAEAAATAAAASTEDQNAEKEDKNLVPMFEDKKGSWSDADKGSKSSKSNKGESDADAASGGAVKGSGQRFDEGSILNIRKLGELLERATSVTKTDPKLWDVAGLYYLGTKQVTKAIECYLAECRALQVGGWESDPRSFELLAAAVVNAGTAFMMIPSRKSLYAAKMLLNTITKRALKDLGDTADFAKIQDVKAAVEAKYEMLPKE